MCIIFHRVLSFCKKRTFILKLNAMKVIRLFIPNTKIQVIDPMCKFCETNSIAKSELNTSRNDSLFNSGSRGVESVVHAIFFLVDLDLAAAADSKNSDSGRQSGQPFLQFLLLVIGSRVRDLIPQLIRSSVDVGFVSLSFEHKRVILGDDDFSNLAQVAQLKTDDISSDIVITPKNVIPCPYFDVLDFDQVGVVSEDDSTGGNGHVLHRRFPVVAEAWGLDCGDLESDLQPIDDQGGQSLAVDVFGDDDQRLPLRIGQLEGRDDALDGGDLLVAEQDQGILELDLGALARVYEVGGDVPSVELHALDDFQFVDQGLAVFHGDDALFANFLHGVGDEFSDGDVAVGRDRRYLGNFLGRRHGFAQVFQLVLDHFHGQHDA